MMSISELDATPTHSGPITQMQESSAAVGRADRSLPRPVLSFEIPEKDREFFRCQLPPAVQMDVTRMLRFAQAIQASGNVAGTCKRLAAQLARSMGGDEPPRGWAWKSILRKYYEFIDPRGVTRPSGEYIEPHSWEIFWDKAKHPDTRSMRTATMRAAIPAEFVQFLRANHDNNQRGKFAQVYNSVLHLWRTHYLLNDMEFPSLSRVIKAGQRVAKIPGYSTWPEASVGAAHPDGWSLSNLQRKCERDNFERDAVTIGKAAASVHRLKVHTSRTKLLCGEFYEFDDHEFNVKVVYPGQRKYLRPRGFFAIDILSASCFARGLKPTLWDAELEKKEGLTEQDFMWFVVSVLTRHGYRPDERGTSLVVERGTAAIREEFEQRIHDATRGKVKVSRGGKFQQRAHIGQLHAATPGHGKGNYRFKALIESFFSLVDNAFASMPGQTGLNRDRCPEQLAMLEAECRDLLLAQGHFGEAAGGIELPMLTWDRFFWQAQQLMDFIDDRKRHQLEGWEKLGFISAPLTNAATGEIVVPARRLSPKEVFAAGSHGLTRLPLYELPALLGVENCYRAGNMDTVEVRNGVVSIDNSEWTGESDTVRFLAVDYRGDRLKNGERFRAYLNPFDTSVLVLCDAQNRAVAQCPRWDAPSRNDVEGVKRAMGQASQWQARALEEVNARHVAGGSEIARRREHNANVIAGRSLRDEDRQQAATERTMARRLAAEPDDYSALSEPAPALDPEPQQPIGEGGDQLSALKEFQD